MHHNAETNGSSKHLHYHGVGMGMGMGVGVGVGARWRGSIHNCRQCRETGITLRDHPGTTAFHTTTWRWPPKSVPFGAWQIPSIRSRSFTKLRRTQPDEHRRCSWQSSKCQCRCRCCPKGRVVRLRTTRLFNQHANQ